MARRSSGSGRHPASSVIARRGCAEAIQTLHRRSDSGLLRFARNDEATYQDVPRRMCVRVLPIDHPHQSKEGAGKAGCRPHPRSACSKKHAAEPQARPNNRPSLRNGLTAYTYSPRCTGLLATVATGIITPATWRQRRGARTIRLRRPARIVRPPAKQRSADPDKPSHPALNVRDDRETSLLVRRDGDRETHFLKKRKKNICRERGDTGDRLERAREMSFSALAISSCETRLYRCGTQIVH